MRLWTSTKWGWFANLWRNTYSKKSQSLFRHLNLKKYKLEENSSREISLRRCLYLTEPQFEDISCWRDLESKNSQCEEVSDWTSPNCRTKNEEISSWRDHDSRKHQFEDIWVWKHLNPPKIPIWRYLDLKRSQVDEISNQRTTLRRDLDLRNSHLEDTSIWGNLNWRS